MLDRLIDGLCVLTSLALASTGLMVAAMGSPINGAVWLGLAALPVAMLFCE